MNPADHPTAQPELSLAPLRMGEILDQAIRLYRRHFLTFVGILAVVLAPLSFLQMLSSLASVSAFIPGNPTATDPSQVYGLLAAGLGGSFVTILLQFILVQGVAGAALTRAIADTFTGKPINVRRAYCLSGDLWGRLVVTLIFAGVASLVLVIWTIIPCIGWFTGIGMLIFFSASVMPLLAPIVVLEGKTPIESLRRAWDLARSRLWWMIGFSIIVYLFSTLMVTGPTAVVEAVFTPFGVSRLPNGQVIQVVLSAILGLVSSLVFLPLQSTTYILAYLDLRVRSEGLDLALAVAQAQGPLDDLQIVTARTAPAPQKNLITPQDGGKFALLSIGAFALYFVFILGLGLFFASLGTRFNGLR